MGSGAGLLLPNVECLRRLRDERGWTNEVLQERTGVARHTLHKIFNVKGHKVQMRVIEKFARTFEVPETRLFLVEPSTPPPAPVAALSPGRVYLGRLPAGSQNFLVGREEELGLLDHAWSNPKVNLISLIGIGGVGKTALVRHWLNIHRPGYLGAEMVIGWSFSGQDVEDKGIASASDNFLSAALKCFGIDDGRLGQWPHKARQLTEFMQRTRTLLILDGLDALQSPPGQGGGILAEDEPLKDLLRDIAEINPGLCIVTSRLPLRDLTAAVGHTVIERPLQKLTPEASRELLTTLGVQGRQQDFDRLARNHWNHPLCLSLLARYLVDVYPHDPDIRYLFETSLIGAGDECIRQPAAPSLMDVDAYDTFRARRIAEDYERWLDPARRTLLRIVALFDEPVAASLVESFCMAGPAADSEGPLRGLNRAKWNALLAEFRVGGLLVVGDLNGSRTLDLHPILRTFFRERMKATEASLYKAGHEFFYREALTHVTGQFANVDDLAPVYRAIYHACEAGLWEEVFEELIWSRMMRGYQSIYLHSFGTGGMDLISAAAFFRNGYFSGSNLPEAIQDPGLRGRICWWAGLVLRMHGRFSEAIGLFDYAHRKLEVAGDQFGTGAALGYLSRSHLFMGDVRRAADLGRQCVEFAKTNTSDRGLIKIAFSAYGSTLHHLGDLVLSRHYFQEADAIHEHTPGMEATYALQEFQYIDMLLDSGDFEEVLRRQRSMLSVYSASPIAQQIVNILILCRMKIEQRASHPEFSAELAFASKLVVQTVNRAVIDHQVRAMLAVARANRVAGDQTISSRLLAHAFDTVQRSGLHFLEVDCRLERMEHELAKGNCCFVATEAETTQRLIDKSGYFVRQPALDRIKRAVALIVDLPTERQT